MCEDVDDCETYLKLDGTAVLLPDTEEDRPAPVFLRWHNDNRFRG
jgi:hypothetical protein